MEGTPKSRRRVKLKKNRVAENKCDVKERTPIKAILPQEQSTPVDSETIRRVSPTTVVENGDVNEDEDDDQHSPFQFHCTQDTLLVGWDCGSPQHKSRKRLGLKVKRKLSKGNTFAHKKQSLGSCSPIEPLRPRRRFNIEKPGGDFSELIPQLQVVADLVKSVKDQDARTTHHSSCDEICVENSTKMDERINFTTKEGEGGTSSDADVVLAVDVPKKVQEVYVSDAQKMQGHSSVTPREKLSMSKGIENDTFTALFDDDADELMLQCSQEIEENLNKNVSLVCSGNKELLLPGYKKNYPVSVQPKIRSPEICKPVRILKCNSNNVKKPDSPKVGTKYYVRIKSGTPKHSKDEHSQFRSSLYSSSDSMKLRNGKTSMDSAVISSKSSPTSEGIFDDSFDAVIQNLSEDDMKMLSQGHAVEKNDAGKTASTESGKQFYQNVKDTTEVNCRKANVLKLAAGQSSYIHRPSVKNKTIHQSNKNREPKYTNQGTAGNESCAPRNSNIQFQLKVPSGICNNKKLSDQPCPVAPVQLNKPHFNTDVPPINNEVFVTWQGHSTSAVKKNSDTVCCNPCTTVDSPACKYYVRIKPGNVKYSRDENCTSGFSVNCISASVRKCHGHPHVYSRRTEDWRHSRHTVRPPCSILDTL